MANRKPLVVSLGKPQYIDAEYLGKFSQSFDFFVLDAYDHDTTRKKLPEFVKNHGPIDAFIIRMGTMPYEPFSAELFAPLVPGCKIVTSASAGFNEFDTKWMTRNGIWFCNTVDAVAEPTADMALFLTLAVVRNATNGEKSARLGHWRGQLVPTKDPSGLTLGIVGMGSIGKYLARKAAVFNMKIVYTKRSRLPVHEEEKYAATYYESLHEMLAVSDVVSLNCPLNDDTRGLIGPKEFAAMKDGAFLVNTARGLVVDEKSLIDALESGKIARAGLDVFDGEPNINPYFRQSDRVVIQPHLGGLTDVAFQRAERECFENIRAYFEKGVPNSPVNTVER